MEANLEFSDFCRSIQEGLEQKKELKKYQFTIENGAILIARIRNGQTSSAEMKLDDAYERYCKSGDYASVYESLEKYLTEIGANLDKCLESNQKEKLIKENLIFKLVNTRYNSDYLQDAPHREIGDMSVVYCWKISDKLFGKLTNNVMEKLGWTEEMLYEMAYKNTREMNPPVLESIYEAIGPTWDTSYEKEIRAKRTLVLTNQSKDYGAVMMLYDDLLQSAAKRAGEDIYVLPSSVHEVILMPVSLTNGVMAQLRLREVNRKEVKPKDTLSYTAYKYDAKAHTLKPADFGGRKRKSKKTEKQPINLDIADKVR